MLIFLLIIFSVFSVNVYGETALTLEQCKCITERVQLELDMNPAYVWGASGLSPGAPGDCSGKIYAIFASCDVRDRDGKPVKRSTSLRMAQGKDGWNFPYVGYDDMNELAIYFMTMKPERPDGHVGLIFRRYKPDDKHTTYELAHASSSLGFTSWGILPEMSNWAYKTFSGATQP